MIKRAVVKTIIICFGIFLIATSIFLLLLFRKYPLDSENRYYVAVASVSIDEGQILEPNMISMNQIRESGFNNYMTQDVNRIIGKRLLTSIRKGDFITDYKLQEISDLYTDDERILAIELCPIDRIANIVTKGNFVDIVLKYKNVKKLPDIVLSKVKVQDLIDANGKSVENYVSSKTLYAKLKLGKQQRERLYAAADLGQLFCEAYGSDAQMPQVESFEIPNTYLNNIEK